MRVVDKERSIVEKTSIEDMLLFPSLPYRFNCPIIKYLNSNSHPFAFIELDFYNRSIAKADLLSVNSIICTSRKLSNLIPKNIHIPVEEVVFEQQNSRYGYTRLICTPRTYSGRLAKYPVRLSFMTDLSQPGNTAHGNLFYNAKGIVSKAKVCIWKNGIGYFFTLLNVDGSLVITQISSSVKTKPNGLPDVIYKHIT